MASDKTKPSPPVVDTPMEDAKPPQSGFTAVNGAVNTESPRTNGHISPRESAAPPRAEESSRSNPQHRQVSSTASQSASPPTSADVLRNGTPASLESPPTRKRSFPDAFGEPSGRVYYKKVNEDESRSEMQHGHEAYPAHRAPRSETPDDHPGAADRPQRALASDYDPHASVPQPYYTPAPAPPAAHDDTDQRLVDALRRDSEDHPGHLDGPHGHADDYGSQDGDDVGAGPASYGEYSTSRSGVQVNSDRKNRKRVFSNRTKTGCLTCRKRKKKCDEHKPECEFFVRFLFALLLLWVLALSVMPFRAASHVSEDLTCTLLVKLAAACGAPPFPL